MNKKTKYALHAGAWGGLGNGLLNILNQLNEKPGHPIDWSCVLKAAFKGGVICGTGGFIVGAYLDYQNSLEKPINTDSILSSIISDSRLTESDRLFLKLCGKADWLIEQIRNEFKGSLNGEPFRFGSTEDGTALKEKYDIDVSVSFKSNAFVTIADMYYTLEQFLRSLEGRNGIVKMRNQNVSVGVFFDLGHGHKGKVDIVPIKITRRRGNTTSGYIHKNPKSILESHSYQKTDTTLLSNQILSKTQKGILVALKKWKRQENIPISSHLLQNLICDAYSCNKNKIPTGITNKIIMVLVHIRDYIETMHLRSIENSNNVLTDIPYSDKLLIKDACKKIIEDFEYQPNSIVDYFN